MERTVSLGSGQRQTGTWKIGMRSRASSSHKKYNRTQHPEYAQWVNNHRGHLGAGILVLLEDNLSELVVAHHCISARNYPNVQNMYKRANAGGNVAFASLWGASCLASELARAVHSFSTPANRAFFCRERTNQIDNSLALILLMSVS